MKNSANMISKENALGSAQKAEANGNYRQAISLYKKALELQQGDEGFIQQRLAIAFARTKRIDDAIAASQKAISINAELPLNYVILGECYLTKGELELAQQALTTALNLDESFFLAYLPLSGVYTASGHLDQAREILAKAVQLRPTSQRARLAHLDLLLKQRLYKEALIQIKEAQKHHSWPLPGILAYFIIAERFLTLHWGKIPIPLRVVLTLIVYAMAILAPLFVSIPIGILLTAYLTLVTFMGFWKMLILKRFYIEVFIISTVVFPMGWLSYWFLVWLGSFLNIP